MTSLRALCAEVSAVQVRWAARTWGEREAVLRKVADRLMARADEVTQAIADSCGKTRFDALSAEVVPAIMAARWYAKHARKACRSHRSPGGTILLANKRSRLHYHPWGVVGIISPWNYPFSIPFSELAMALVTGNGVLLKVASFTRTMGPLLESLFREAGLPDGLLQVVDLPGAQAGPAMVESGISKLFFTGSVSVGKELAALAAPRLLPLVLELGGNDAAVVRQDADLDLTARGLIWAGLSNAGQSCGGVQRILVDKRIFEPFCQILASRLRQFRAGAEGDDRDLGSMVSPGQKADVLGLVQRGLAEGATYLVDPSLWMLPSDGGRQAWLAPMVIINVGVGSPLWREEVFGPVMVLVPFTTEEEAIALANDSSMGLTASVWSRNRGAARAMGQKIHAGAVMVNDHLMSHGLAETPWGGVGESGWGRTHGYEGIREMVQSQVVVDDIMPFRRSNPWWHPHGVRVYQALKSLPALLWGEGLGAKARAVGGVFRTLLGYWRKPPVN